MSVARDALSVWRRHPEIFAYQMLGLRLWDKQIEIMRGLRDGDRVSVKSCHKAGKSLTASTAALWFASCFPQARVVLTAPTHRQVKGVLWKEVRRLIRASKAGPRPGDSPEEARRAVIRQAMGWPDPHVSPDDGLQFEDGREIIGFSTVEPERMAGFSGPNQLFIADEASGIPDVMHDAIDSARAGGAKVLMISNPTRAEGYFFDSFGKNAEFWNNISISAYDVPSGIQGLTNASWAAQKLVEWGVQDARYQVRVLGEFASEYDDDVIPRALLTAHLIRHEHTSSSNDVVVGVDPARYGQDDSVIAVNVGGRISDIYRIHGQNTVAIAARVSALLVVYPDAIVNVDANGIGGGVADILRAEQHMVNEINAGDSATSKRYHRLKDQIVFAFRQWLEDGGFIVDDKRLIEEILSYKYSHTTVDALRVSSKKEILKRIGRSPDSADAVFLAAWRPLSARGTDIVGPSRVTAPRDYYARDEDDDDDDWP